jgi:hypothetical protein
MDRLDEKREGDAMTEDDLAAERVTGEDGRQVAVEAAVAEGEVPDVTIGGKENADR